MKGLLTKKFKEDEQSSSMNSEGFTDLEKSKWEKEHDNSSASFIHIEDEKPIEKKRKKKKKKVAA